MRTRLYLSRRKLELSEQEVSDYRGVGQDELSRWEKGLVKPSLPVLRQLATLYHVTLEFLQEDQYGDTNS